MQGWFHKSNNRKLLPIPCCRHIHFKRVQSSDGDSRMQDSQDTQQASAFDEDPQLGFDPRTAFGRDGENIDDWKKMPLGGGRFVTPFDNDRIEIIPLSNDKEKVSVTTMHISCQSDTYNLGHRYGGVIVYQYDGKSEWRTANNTHCKSGYIVIQDTDREDVKKLMGKEPGIVHGAVYRNAFGESVPRQSNRKSLFDCLWSVRNTIEVVGEGFSVRGDGKFEMNYAVFNNPEDSEYHDERKEMHELSEHCVRKIVEYWKIAGPRWVRKKNFEVKEMLEDFDFQSLKIKRLKAIQRLLVSPLASNVFEQY